MLHLRLGDRLPVVATCQMLLNAYRRRGAPIVVDGRFTAETDRAVRAFQTEQALEVDGIIGRQTWGMLAATEQLRVHDSIDVFDAALYSALPHLDRVGARPVHMGGMCDGLSALVGQVAATCRGGRKLALLRFMGHGNNGAQVVSYGTQAQMLFQVLRNEPMPPHHAIPNPEDMPPHEVAIVRLEAQYSGLTLNGLVSNGEVTQRLRQLGEYFAPFGSVEFHGCQVGGGERGRSFLRVVSEILRVPAVGAHRGQSTRNAVRFRGPVEIQTPGGRDLSTWAAGLPAYSGA